MTRHRRAFMAEGHASLVSHHGALVRRRLLTMAVALAVATTGIATGTSSTRAGEPFIDTFTRQVAEGLGTSEIEAIPWELVEAPSYPVEVTGSEAHWRMNQEGSHNENAWRLDLGEDRVSPPFEVKAKLRVVESAQASSILNTFGMHLYLTGDEQGRGTFSYGSSAGLELYQRPSTPNTLNIYPYDDRQGSGATYSDSEGQLLPGFWSGAPFWVRMQVTEQGIQARAWSDGSDEPATWDAVYSGDPEFPVVDPFRWLGVTVGSISATSPTIDVYLDSLEIIDGFAVGPTSNPPATVIFVHGLSASVDNEQDFDTLLSRVRDEFSGSVVRFEHYQDLGSIDPTTQQCAPVEPIIPEEPNGGMPVDADTIGPICDSQGDLALNSVLLHARVQQAFHESDGAPVILVGNSMGAAIIRGFVAYSAERLDGVADTMVDSILYLQGAQDGVLWLALALDRVEGIRLLGPVGDAILDFGTRSTPANLSRPAAEDLASVSDWYQWVNPPPAHVGETPAFNMFGDINIAVDACVPFAGCLQTSTLWIGDIAIMPGTDDPHDLTLQGGARYLRDVPGTQNWQWGLGRTIRWDPGNPFSLVSTIRQAASAPEYHGAFGDRMAEISVADCQTRETVAADEALVRVIRGRMLGQPYACAP